MAGGPRNWTTRERLEARLASMKELRKPFEADWQEIERLCLPTKSQILSPNATLKRRANMAKQDTAGRIAGRTLVNGMATGLSSSSRPWFKLSVRDPDLAEFQPVKEWLHDTERRIYALFSSTNYYDAAKIAYAQLGHMGVGATFATEHDQYGAVYHALETGEYWISQDEGLRTNAIARRPLLTVDQAVAKFPWEKLSQQVRDAYDRGNVHQVVPFIHMVEANTGRDQRYIDVTNKPWRSVWWEEGNNDKSDNALLRTSGYDSKPFTAPRWETTGAMVYSDLAPAFDALPDLRELELVARRAGRAMDLMVRPPIGVPGGLNQTPISLDPGSVNYFNELAGKIEPIIRPDPNVINAIESNRDWLTRRINQIFYADLWMAITDMEGVQPRNEQELIYRNEEKLTQLGPVVDRVNIEKLETDIDRAYTILDNNDELMPLPDELKETSLTIGFTSILAQAQLAAANTQIERAARFVGFLTGQFPDAAIKFDAEQAVDEFAANAGTSPKIIRSDDVVAEMKAQMAQQQQAEQAMQAAPAMRDGAQAAELLSRTQVGPQGVPMLDQLMGV
jgi:hypothetical protein